FGLDADIFPDGGPKRNSLVEISGAQNTGKTLLLMQLVAKFLLRGEVIFINVSHKIDVQLLGGFIKDELRSANDNATPTEIQESFEKCIGSLEMINCYSSEELEMTLESLDNHMLLEKDRVGLIVIDALCEFYWLDFTERKRMTKYCYYMETLNRIRMICNKFHVCCMFTVDTSFINPR
ncbi:Rad51D, partial [Drosophila busckii]